MSDVLADIAAYLVAQNIEVADRTWSGTVPPSPDRGVILTNNGSGLPSERALGSADPIHEFPIVDVEFRGDPNKFDGPMTKAGQAHLVLARVSGIPIVPGGVIYWIVTPLQEPYLFQVDANKRPRIGFSIAIQKDPDQVTLP